MFQLHRTEDLIAIFCYDDERIFRSRKPLVASRRKAEYLAFWNAINEGHSTLLNDVQASLKSYKSELLSYYSSKSSGSESTDDDNQIDKPQRTEEVPSRKFTDAVLSYAQYLKETHRNHMVVEVRNKITRIFHLIGMNKEREALGDLALEATFITRDPISRAEILIDDLGWALHLQDRTPEAASNIKDAIDLLGGLEELSPELEVRAGLAVAKAFRHLSLFESTRSASEALLEKGERVISRLKEDDVIASLFSGEIKRDEAQLMHARSLLLAKYLGVESEGSIDLSNSIVLEEARIARQLANDAASSFSEIGDMERQAKALTLLERLQDALGERMSAIQTKALRDDIQSRSGIDRQFNVN